MQLMCLFEPVYGPRSSVQFRIGAVTSDDGCLDRLWLSAELTGMAVFHKMRLKSWQSALGVDLRIGDVVLLRSQAQHVVGFVVARPMGTCAFLRAFVVDVSNHRPCLQGDIHGGPTPPDFGPC